GVDVHLLPKEMGVLQFLAKNKNQIVDVDALLNSVWSSESEASEDAVRQTIARLRRKIESSKGETLIKTVKGYGYVIEDRS
ncbi:MAG: helix-turn-helix domain-containing protein, partial [Leptolyngbya sp.]|nr:helix-turn-helix domain-containing protein [Candidatus Melainabacteria bacterium]